MTPAFTAMFVRRMDGPEGFTEDYVAQILVSGTGPLPYATGFDARLENEIIEGVSVNGGGTGFTGYVRNMPAEGARLFVQFEGDDPIDTGLTFTSGPIA